MIPPWKETEMMEIWACKLETLHSHRINLSIIQMRTILINLRMTMNIVMIMKMMLKMKMFLKMKGRMIRRLSKLATISPKKNNQKGQTVRRMMMQLLFRGTVLMINPLAMKYWIVKNRMEH
jgi:hypothetical protein